MPHIVPSAADFVLRSLQNFEAQTLDSPRPRHFSWMNKQFFIVAFLGSGWVIFLAGISSLCGVYGCMLCHVMLCVFEYIYM